eukprot:scaffold26687_cov222-Skeletonema_menzelii.AAC.2
MERISQAFCLLLPHRASSTTHTDEIGSKYLALLAIPVPVKAGFSLWQLHHISSHNLTGQYFGILGESSLRMLIDIYY